MKLVTSKFVTYVKTRIDDDINRIVWDNVKTPVWDKAGSQVLDKVWKQLRYPLNNTNM